MPMTPAERKAAQRAKGRAPGSNLCTLCGNEPRRPGLKTGERCAGERTKSETPHTCAKRGGLGVLDPRCARCREIAKEIEETT